MNNSRDTFGELRSTLDGKDPFMNQGHQIIKSRRKYKNRKTPDWVKSKENIKRILLFRFPKLKADPDSRAKAAKWARAIHLYFTMGLTFTQLSYELGTKEKDGNITPLGYNKCKMLIRMVILASQGKKSDRKPYKYRKLYPIQTSMGGE